MQLSNRQKHEIVEAILRDLPRVDIRHEVRKYVVRKLTAKMPAALRALAESADAGRLRVQERFFRSRDGGVGVRVEIPGADTEQLTDAEMARVLDMLDELAAVEKVGGVIALRLTEAFRKIDTRNQALAAYPAFEPYLPTLPDDPVVPADETLVSDLQAAGWPRQRAARGGAQ